MQRKKKKYFVIVTFFAFFMIMAFRNRYMGNDTPGYIALFKKIASFDNPEKYIESSSVEAGFVWYCWLISRFWGERALFVITSAFVNFCVGRFVYKYVKYPGIFCCLFVGLMQFDFFMSAMRQSISVAILLLAFEKIDKNKKISFLFLWYVAYQFHNSAIIFLLIAPFLFKTKSDKKFDNSFGTYMLLFIGVLFVSFFFDKVFETVLQIFPKYNNYMDSELSDGEMRLAVILKVAVFATIFLVPKLYKNGFITNIKLYNLGEKLSIINLAMMIIASNATALMRFVGTFGVYALMNFSNCFEKISQDEKKLLLLLTLTCGFIYGLILVVYKTPEWQTTYPINLAL